MMWWSVYQPILSIVKVYSWVLSRIEGSMIWIQNQMSPILLPVSRLRQNIGSFFRILGIFLVLRDHNGKDGIILMGKVLAFFTNIAGQRRFFEDESLNAILLRGNWNWRSCWKGVLEGYLKGYCALCSWKDKVIFKAHFLFYLFKIAFLWKESIKVFEVILTIWGMIKCKFVFSSKKFKLNLKHIFTLILSYFGRIFFERIINALQLKQEIFQKKYLINFLFKLAKVTNKRLHLFEPFTW